MDWSLGEYEHVAAQLLPAAAIVVEHAAPRAGERVLDIGCGTGNAALLAAERGAIVTGIDPAERLLDVARAEAAARSLEAQFMRGAAEALPIADGAADLVLSVFGVIFAEDASAAAAEMARVCAQRGRIVISAWVPGDPIAELGRLRRNAITGQAVVPDAPGPPAWHERGALTDLLGPYGFAIQLREAALSFSAGSAEEFIDSELRSHPVWIACRTSLEPRGEMDALRARLLEVLHAANEDPHDFRVTSHYIVASASRNQG